MEGIKVASQISLLGTRQQLKVARLPLPMWVGLAGIAVEVAGYTQHLAAAPALEESNPGRIALALLAEASSTQYKRVTTAVGIRQTPMAAVSKAATGAMTVAHGL